MLGALTELQPAAASTAGDEEARGSATEEAAPAPTLPAMFRKSAGEVLTRTHMLRVAAELGHNITLETGSWHEFNTAVVEQWSDRAVVDSLNIIITRHGCGAPLPRKKQDRVLAAFRMIKDIH